MYMINNYYKIKQCSGVNIVNKAPAYKVQFINIAMDID